MATVLRTDGDLRMAGHYAMSPLTLLRAGGVLFPMMACQYGPPEAALSGSDPKEDGGSSTKRIQEEPASSRWPSLIPKQEPH